MITLLMKQGPISDDSQFQACVTAINYQEAATLKFLLQKFHLFSDICNKLGAIAHTSPSPEIQCIGQKILDL